NSHWPSFFGTIFDYYLRPGGAYYGAKKGLQPLSAVLDSYATGDHTQAHITLVNQTPDNRSDLRVRVTDDLNVASGDSLDAMTLPRVARDSGVYFVRCEVVDKAGSVLAENVYWQ